MILRGGRESVDLGERQIGIYQPDEDPGFRIEDLGVVQRAKALISLAPKS